MNEKEHQRAADVEEARAKLLECFPGSFIRDSDDVGYEFIAHPRTNQSFILEDCHYVEDIEAKVLEGLMDFTGHINPKITHFRRFYKMEKNYVEIQGRFSSDGKFMDGKYVPGIVDELLDSVSGAFNDTTGLHRLRVTVEVEDLGADVKFGKPASETQHSPAPQRLTVGKLIPAPDISPTAIDPAPEVAV